MHLKSVYPALCLSGTVQQQVHPNINGVTNTCFHLFGAHAAFVVDKMEQTEVIKPQTLDDLIKILHKIFESDTINIEEVQNIMESYDSNPQEWSKFAKFDQYRQVILGSIPVNMIVDVKSILCMCVDLSDICHRHSAASFQLLFCRLHVEQVFYASESEFFYENSMNIMLQKNSEKDVGQGYLTLQLFFFRLTETVCSV